MEPPAGGPGDAVVLSGRGLKGATAVRFGAVPATRFQTAGDTRLLVLVPPGAAGGPIRVTTPLGSAQTRHGFRIHLPAPTLLQVSPGHGPPGTRVLLVGTGFSPGMRVRFGAVPAGPVQVEGLGRAWVRVPPGRGGRVRVVTPAGGAAARQAFRVTPARSRLTLELADVSLTQGTQTPGLGVPLVAGRDALLLATVLADRPNRCRPWVRIRLRDRRGRPLLTADAPGPSGGVPEAAGPADLDALWTLPIPGRLLQPGCTLQAELRPDRGGPALAAWPGPGRARALRVVRVPRLRITLLPVVQDGLTGNVDDPPRRLADWVDRFRAMFPVARVEVRKGPALRVPGVLRPGDYDAWQALLARVEARRRADHRGADEIYVGVVKVRYRHGYSGCALTAPAGSALDRSAVCWDRGPLMPGDNMAFPMVFAHEMGHLLGRMHAPSTPPGLAQADLDPGYPKAYAKADIGAFGMDVAARRPKAPGSYRDIMGYTPPCWVSDYTYRGALDYLLRLEARLSRRREPGPRRPRRSVPPGPSAPR